MFLNFEEFQVELMTPDTDTNGTDTTGKES